MTLSKEQKLEWEEKVKEGTFFLVGVEINNQRKGTFINLLGHFNGNIKGVPSVEKGVKRKGKFAKGMVIDEFIKTQFDAGLMLKDASDDIINDIMFVDGHLHNYIKDLFVDAYFKTNYIEILGGVRHWNTIKGILNGVNPEQAAKDIQAETEEKPKET